MMKKLLLLLTIGILVFFSGCAKDAGPYEPYPDPDPYYKPSEYITFETSTLSFQADIKDVYKTLKYDHHDFFYIYQDYLPDLTDTEINSLNTLFDLFNELDGSVSVYSLVNYDLSEFRATLENNGLTPTPEAIFTYNLFIELYDELPARVTFYKIDIAEYKLDRTLTTNEIDAIEQVEVYYGGSHSNYEHIEFDFETGTFEELITYIETSYTLNQLDIDEIRVGYDIIIELLE